MGNVYSQIADYSAKELIEWLEINFAVEMPEKVENAEDLKKAGELISQLTSYYSYIMSMYLYAKAKVREVKREKQPKEYIDECVDKRDVLKDFADMIKLQYTAISRMITVKKQIDEELKMLNLT